MSEDLPREEILHMVDRMVEELLHAAGNAEPPVDAVSLARRHLGLPPATSRRSGRHRDDGVPPAGGANPVEEQWLAAQDIGAHFKPALLGRLGIEAEQAHGMGGASLANLFAQHLLTPRVWFASDARSLGYDVLELTKRYSTAGTERLAWRLLDLEESCIITVVDNDHVQRRRSNAWPVRRALLAPERECQRYVNHYSRPRVVVGGGWTVQGWPVHRSDWKREILRTVGEPGDGEME
jgi:hypothetical protein